MEEAACYCPSYLSILRGNSMSETVQAIQINLSIGYSLDPKAVLSFLEKMGKVYPADRVEILINYVDLFVIDPETGRTNPDRNTRVTITRKVGATLGQRTAAASAMKQLMDDSRLNGDRLCITFIDLPLNSMISRGGEVIKL